jgi:hypothetical protein
MTASAKKTVSASYRAATRPNHSDRSASAFALTLISAVSLIAGVHAAQAGINAWTTHGPYGGANVHALAIDPSTPRTLYAGWGRDVGGVVSGGVYKSTDGGSSWIAMLSLSKNNFRSP